VQCSAVLCCAVLCCVVLCCVVLLCAVLSCPVLSCSALHCAALRCAALCRAVLCCDFPSIIPSPLLPLLLFTSPPYPFTLSIHPRRFFDELGLDYVSCAASRIPIAKIRCATNRDGGCVGVTLAGASLSTCHVLCCAVLLRAYLCGGLLFSQCEPS
jgi:hypothetical protein